MTPEYIFKNWSEKKFHLMFRKRNERIRRMEVEMRKPEGDPDAFLAQAGLKVHKRKRKQDGK